MKILVTGSSGFIGSRICQALVRQGHSVRAFHRSTSSLRGLEDLVVEHILGDLTQPTTLLPALEGVEVVFHTGALVGKVADPAKRYAVTVEGTRAVVQAALQAGVRRLVHTSSAAALGVPDRGPLTGKNPSLLDENHSWNYAPDGWQDGYAKYLAEIEIQKGVAQGLDAVILNPSGVFGAGDVYRTSSSIITQVARGRVPVAIEGGLNVVHIDDVVAGHLAALERGRCGERYILGGQNMTFLTFVNLIASVTGTRPARGALPAWLARSLSSPLRWFHEFTDLPVDAELLRLSGHYFYYTTQKAREELGLGDPRPPREAIQDAWDWFRDQPTSPFYRKSQKAKPGG